jgi:type II secretory pathway component PulC
VNTIRLEGPTAAEQAALDAEVAARMSEARLELRRAAIQPAGEDSYVIVGQIFDELDLEPGELLAGARVVPYTERDKPAGLKLYAIDEDSWLARLGFENGDTVNSINDLALKSPADALALQPQLRDAKELKVGLKRRGKAKTLTYRLLR